MDDFFKMALLLGASIMTSVFGGRLVWVGFTDPPMFTAILEGLGGAILALLPALAVGAFIGLVAAALLKYLHS